MKQYPFLTTPSKDSILSVSKDENGQFHLFVENKQNAKKLTKDFLTSEVEPNKTGQSQKIPVIYFGLDDSYIINF